MKQVELFGGTYIIKPTLKAYALFESLSGISIFKMDDVEESLSLNLQFLYALLAANNKGFMSYGEFLERWDDVPNAFAEVGKLVRDVVEETANSIADATEGLAKEEDEASKKN